jgi:hypothetical protein
MKDHEPTKRQLRRSGSLGGVGMFTTLAFLGVSALVSGCGSSSSPEAFADFEGTWRLTADPVKLNSFRLVCPAPISFNDDFPLFTQQIMEPGTLSDLFESSGPGSCQFAFDAVPKMKAVSIVNPDPFTGMPSGCLALDLGTSTDPLTAHDIDTQMVLTPSSWVFNLLAPVKGKAPAAQLIGHAAVDIVDIDVTANPSVAVGSTACTYDITANLDKVAKL